MRKICYRLVYNRKNRLNAQGMALLQIEAYLDKKKTYFSSRIYLYPEQWDVKRKMIVRHPNADSLNYMVREFMINLEQKEILLWKNGQEVSLESLKEVFLSKAEKTFTDFMKEEIKDARIKESTKKNRQTTYFLLSKFKSSISFKDITPNLIYSFEKYLYDNGFQVNTVAKHMKHLKAFVNAAINKGYIDANDYAFRRYRIKMEESRHSFLLPEEIQKLEEIDLSKRHTALSHTLDAFLFCCYTGLRYSDFVNMTENNLKIIEGKPWLIFHTVKTGTEVKLPLSFLFDGKAWKLLRKYMHRWNDFFKLKPNSTVNKELVRIGRLAKIEKHFSFHSARHTNATILIYKGVNITTVQKLLGHRNVSTTQIYSEVMASTIVKDLKKCSKHK